MFKELAFMVITTLLIEISMSQCQNGGANILTRTKQRPYVIDYYCLCPYIYYGESCQNLRNIYCRFSNQKVTKYNPSTSTTADLQFDLECFLMKLNQNATFQSKQVNNFYKLPLNQTTIKQQLRQLNYYVNKSVKIIWANDTILFENNGELVRDVNDSRTDDEILDSYQPYEFHYENYFEGVPLSNVDVYFNLTAVSFTKSSTYLPTPAIKFKKLPSPSNGMRNIGEVSVSMKKQWQEYNVARLQLLLSSTYGTDRIQHRMGMNSGKWRVFNPTITKGTILQSTTNKIPPSFWVILAFISIFVLIYGGRLAVRLYKSYRNRKNIKQIHADDDQIVFNKDED